MLQVSHTSHALHGMTYSAAFTGGTADKPPPQYDPRIDAKCNTKYSRPDVLYIRCRAAKMAFSNFMTFWAVSNHWLSWAGRDAIALHGLFTDTLGGETMLVADG